VNLGRRLATDVVSARSDFPTCFHPGMNYYARS
jgi:hypothetical protein